MSGTTARRRPILAAANGVIDLASERFTKNLWTDRAAGEPPQLVSVRDEADQANYIVERVLENREGGLSLKEQAVLFRASHHSGPLELELTRSNIPFVKYGGLKFLDAAHVKDLLALLRFAENPRDRVAGFRLLQLLPGIGPATAQAVLDRIGAAANPGRELVEGPAPPKGSVDWRGFVAAYDLLRERRRDWPSDIEVARRWYEPHLERIHEDAASRRADLLQLEQIAHGYPSRERFLTELTLDPPEATSGEAGVPHLDEDYLILSTIHSAKGQEWKSVFVLNAVDGCIPSDMGDGHRRRDRGGAPAALRRDDARAREPAPARAAALLHKRPAGPRRSARLRGAHPLYTGRSAQAFRGDGVARPEAGGSARAARERRPRGCRRPHARDVAITRLTARSSLLEAAHNLRPSYG